MTTNIQGTRTTTPPADQTYDRIHDRTHDRTVESVTNRAVEPTPIVTPTGLGGVAVYDHGADRLADTTSPAHGSIPTETRSTTSVFNWILGAIVLIAVLYFLIQLIF